MCIFVSRPMKIVPFLLKNGYPPERVVDFPRERATFRNKIMEIVEDCDENSYNNNGKPWKSSRILRVNPFFHLSLFFSSFFHLFHFFHFSHFFIYFIFSFLHFSFIFFHFLSCSFIFVHFLSCSFMFFHVLSCTKRGRGERGSRPFLLLFFFLLRPFWRSTCLRGTTSRIRSEAGDMEKPARTSSMHSTSSAFSSASPRKASAEASIGCSTTCSTRHERAHSRCHCAAPDVHAARPPPQEAPAAFPGVGASVAVARSASRPPLPLLAPPPAAPCGGGPSPAPWTPSSSRDGAMPGAGVPVSAGWSRVRSWRPLGLHKRPKKPTFLSETPYGGGCCCCF